MGFIPLLLSGMVCAGFAALWLLGFQHIYLTGLRSLGVPAFRYPLLDTAGITAAIQCSRSGIDVFRIDPCDVFGRVHAYSPLWLRADVLPVTVGWTPYVGVVFVLLFFWAMSRLPRASSGYGVLLMAAAGVSPPVLYALERGNNDLLVFAMATAATVLLLRRGFAAWFGTAIVTFAAALKYYPLVLLVQLLRERTGRCLLLGGLSLAVLAAAILLDLHELRIALRDVPTSGPFSLSFGASALPFGLARLFGWPRAAGLSLQVLLMAGSAAIAWRLAGALRAGLAALAEPEAMFLTAGSAVLAGCFMAAVNIGYREIFFLMVLPGLIQLSRGKSQSGQLAAISLGLVLFLLWLPALFVASGGDDAWWLLWPLQVVAWWWIVTVLLAVLWDAVLSSPALVQPLAVVRHAARKRALRSRMQLPSKANHLLH